MKFSVELCLDNMRKIFYVKSRNRSRSRPSISRPLIVQGCEDKLNFTMKYTKRSDKYFNLSV